MRKSPLLLLVLLAACDLIDAATAEKPNGAQQNAIGDIFGQVGTIAAVADDPATTSNGDLVAVVTFDHFARLVAPSSAKPRAAARRKPAPVPACISTAGDVHTFTACDVSLVDGRQCVFDGSVTRTAEGSGNRYAGGFVLGGATSCPTADLTVDVYLEGPTDNPTLARGNLQFAMHDPAGDDFTGSAIVDDIAVTGNCTVPSSGEMTVRVDGVAGGQTIANRSITLAFHDSPGCGLITIE